MRLFDIPLEKLKTNNQDRRHSVTVEFLYGIEELDPLHELEKELAKAIEGAGVGEYDGHLVAMDSTDGILYMYGPNAESLFKTVLPILERSDFMKGAVANLRFGPLDDEDASEIDVEIN